VRIAKNRETVQLQEAEIQQLATKKPNILADAAVARQRLESFERTVVALERAFDDRSSAIRAAQRLLREAEDYDALVVDRSKNISSLEEIELRLTKTRETLAAHRASVADTIAHLSAQFGSVLREFVPGDINGEVKLDGNGLALKVQLAGERSTAAIESLKVVAFDLAVLAMTIEGRTRLSGFLVHDSPREADLGASIYHRLFGFVARLEAFGPNPLFQYIVTTTTEPPDEFRVAPWLALTIRGAPAQDRLLKADL
jgi:hypothetical protein